MVLVFRSELVKPFSQACLKILVKFSDKHSNFLNKLDLFFNISKLLVLIKILDHSFPVKVGIKHFLNLHQFKEEEAKVSEPTVGFCSLQSSYQPSLSCRDR